MKRSRFTEVQVAYALRQAEAGMPVIDVCGSLGISEATCYIWKKKYGDLGASEVRRLRQLEEGNARFKRVVADLTVEAVGTQREKQDILTRLAGVLDDQDAGGFRL